MIVEEQLGLKRTSFARFRKLAAQLPFEPSIAVVSNLAGGVEASLHRPADQVQIAREFFGDNKLTRRLAEIVRQDPAAHVFAPQSLTILMRLLIDHAADVALGEELTEDQILLLMEAVVASSSLTERGLDLNVGKFEEDLLAYELQVSGYYARPPWMEELVRARQLSELLSNDPDLRHHVDAVNFEELVSRDSLSTEEQWKLGFGLGSQANAWENGRSPFVPENQFDSWLDRTGLADRKKLATGMISADREEFRSAFSALKAEGPRYIWETRPFQKWPYLRLKNEQGLMLLSRPWALSWLSEGFYYRALDSARDDDTEEKDGHNRHVQNFTSFWGKGYEKRCLDLADHSLSEHGLVLGEQRYGRGGGMKTSDIALVQGETLVLFEINGRMTGAEALISGDAKTAAAELRTQLVKKINQLGVCAGALLSNAARLPDVEISRLERIVPVVVSTGRFWQTRTLWKFLDGERDSTKCESFEDQKVADPQLLRITDFEKLMAAGANGTDLGDLLYRRASGTYRSRDLNAWIRDEKPIKSFGDQQAQIKTRFDEMSEELVDAFRHGQAEDEATT